ncbi:glutathione S-transferase [Actibacterium atlanticum]|uniref:Glutathione S-transferase n=1 Tax=Actibacterium atlanticum TaxID=1461693 RepID=A0A058ZK61_9RHOB|nr:glutathione S-transferase N-terminal domain-containing protein [Actibacterium atlanticum]KCV81176.1 glutathione S-transferase [Actibacterium atlanticum]
MTKFSDFAVATRWPAQNPDILQLYSLATPNGVKVSIMLEEIGLPYEDHKISFDTNDQFDPAFLEISPNNKIPAIVDPNGPQGEAVSIFESAAILIYLAEKSGQLLPTDPIKRLDVLKWLMFQMGSVGPMFGQFGWFHTFAGKEIEDPRGADRYAAEAKRILSVIEKQLSDGRDWIAGDYSIADIAIAPWLNTMKNFYKGGERVGWDEFTKVHAYLERFLDRPAVQTGLKVPA